MSTPTYLPRQTDDADGLLHYEDGQMATDYPALYQLLAHKRDAAGKKRPGARLSLFCDDGKLKACVWDEHTDQSWFMTLESFQGALEAVEATLARSGGEWRRKRRR